MSSLIKSKIKQEYINGTSAKEISKKYNTSTTTVYKIIKTRNDVI